MKRRRFTREFKIDAVRRVLEGEETMASIARDLGVSAGLLGIWKREFSDEVIASLPADKQPAPEDRIRDLERKIRDLEEENEFLKKTSAYFARQDRRGSR